MKIRAALLSVALVVFLVAPVFAQATSDSSALKHPGWNVGVFAGGGRSVTVTPSAGIFTAGGSLGRVLTHEHGGGIVRGTFELGVEAMPAYMFFSEGRSFYGTAFTPLLAKWNFTNGERIMPYFEAAGTVILTADNFPAGDTATTNFASGAGIGMHIFTRPKQAVKLDVRAVHISNASIGNHNPGVNAALVFNIGYTWFK